MENILDHAFSAYVPSEFETAGWIAVYLLGAAAISGLNYATADDEELEDLSDDLDDW